MTFVDLDDIPGADPLPSEKVMLRGLIESLVEAEARIGALHAHQAMLLTAVTEVVELRLSRLPGAARRDREMPLREATSELAAALRITERTVQRRMSDATTLMLRFTRTFTALTEGRITRAHANVIMEAGAGIGDDTARAQFELAALDRAEVETAGRLRSIVHTIAEKANPISLTERHRAAREHRGVFVRDIGDDISELITIQPSVIAHGIHDRLTSMARAGQHAARSAEASDPERVPDERTMDQLRADILADIALAGSAVSVGEGINAIRARVQVTVPVLTLAGVHDHGANLVGVGPMDSATARCLAGNAKGFDRVMFHPVTGAVLAVDRYRATADLERALRVRDEHCRFPGCRQPVWRCDIDHTHDAALGGETSECNLAHLCRRHHSLKHATAWEVRQVGGGTLEWTSPTGLVYIDVPTPTLRFVPDGDPPPF